MGLRKKAECFRHSIENMECPCRQLDILELWNQTVQPVIAEKPGMEWRVVSLRALNLYKSLSSTPGEFKKISNDLYLGLSSRTPSGGIAIRLSPSRFVLLFPDHQEDTVLDIFSDYLRNFYSDTRRIALEPDIRSSILSSEGLKLHHLMQFIDNY